MSPALPTTSAPKLTHLPEAALIRIIAHASGLQNGVLKHHPPSTQTLVRVARVCTRLRTAAAAAVRELHSDNPDFVWPHVKLLAPHAWSQLTVLNVVVNRANILAFLRWLIPARLSELRLCVVGDPFEHPRLAQFERVLLGRLFTSIGHELHVLHVAGIDCQAVLFSALFQCTRLRQIVVEDYGNSSAATLLNVQSLICMANRPHLNHVSAPWNEWRQRMDEIPDGPAFARACRITWGTLWGSYRAGIKESAVNLRDDEDELVAKFKQMSVRMDHLSARMDALWDDLDLAAAALPADDIPIKLLQAIIPGLAPCADGPISVSPMVPSSASSSFSSSGCGTAKTS